MPQWLLSTSMLSVCAPDFSMQPCQAQTPSVRLKMAVVGTGGGTASSPPNCGSTSIGLPPARPFIDAPGIGRPGIAGEGAAERDHLTHALGHHLGELARVEAAEAPADQADLAAVLVAELLDQIDHRMLHALAQAVIATLAPAAHCVALAASETCAARAWTRRRPQGPAAPAPDARRRAARGSAAAARRGMRRTRGSRALPETSEYGTAGAASGQ